MTATIIVKSSSWPVLIALATVTEGSDGGHDVKTEETTLEPDSSITFSLDNPHRLSIRELSPSELGDQDPVDITEPLAPAPSDNNIPESPATEDDPEKAPAVKGNAAKK